MRAMKTFKNRLAAVALVFALAISAVSVTATPLATSGQGFDQQMSKRVRKELVTLPYYGVFDNLAYKIEGGTVTLYGQVVRPSSRSDEARRVAKLKGVERVVNNIEVLPLSTFDDRIRV